MTRKSTQGVANTLVRCISSACNGDGDKQAEMFESLLDLLEEMCTARDATAEAEEDKQAGEDAAWLFSVIRKMEEL